MPYLVAAVIFVGALGLINLVLCMGIIRRLREQAELLARGPSGASGGDTGLLPVGETAGEFTTKSIDGVTITRDDLPGDTIVAFFSPHCQPCKDLVPKFVEYARSHVDGRPRIFAVVSGDRFETAAMVDTLAPVATVTTDEEAKVMVGAFRTTGFPALYLMGRDGTVVASGHGLSALPSLVAA